MTKQELQDHLKQNIWEEDKEGNIYGYGAAVVVSALYKKIYGDYPKIGLSGSQAMAVMELLNALPEQDITLFKPDGNTHVMPDSGPNHYENKACWCEPELNYKDEETKKEVWIHRDTREAAVN